MIPMISEKNEGLSDGSRMRGNMRKGTLTIISGFSGAGKGTVMKALLAKYSSQYALSISATSRKPREGEVNGREYFFKTKEEFEELIAQEKLIEYAKYVDNYYGTPADYVEEQRNAGKDMILEIEIQGALQVKAKYPEAMLIFLTPPSIQELKNRLIGRGTEEMPVIEARLRRAKEEAEYMDRYEYIVVNDTVEECVEQIHRLIQSQHDQVYYRRDFIAEMKKEIEEFVS